MPNKNKIKTKTQSEIISVVNYFNDVISIQSILGIHKSGVCFAKTNYDNIKGVEENLISPLLSVITGFELELEDQMGLDTENKQTRVVEYQGLTVTIIDGKLLRFGIISSSRLHTQMLNKCKKLVKDYEKFHQYDLEKFSGNSNIFSNFQDFIDKEIDSKLKRKCKLNERSIEGYEGPKKIKTLLAHMYATNENFYPESLPHTLARELKISETESKFYTYDLYQCYVFEPI